MSGCRCGHEYRAHQHHRSGTDCVQCVCARFRLDYHQAFSVVQFLIYTSRIWTGMCRAYLRLTRCRLRGQHARISSYSYCLLCGKRVGR